MQDDTRNESRQKYLRDNLAQLTLSKNPSFVAHKLCNILHDTHARVEYDQIDLDFLKQEIKAFYPQLAEIANKWLQRNSNSEQRKRKQEAYQNILRVSANKIPLVTAPPPGSPLQRILQVIRSSDKSPDRSNNSLFKSLDVVELPQQYHYAVDTSVSCLRKIPKSDSEKLIFVGKRTTMIGPFLVDSTADIDRLRIFKEREDYLLSCGMEIQKSELLSINNSKIFIRQNTVSGSKFPNWSYSTTSCVVDSISVPIKVWNLKSQGLESLESLQHDASVIERLALELFTYLMALTCFKHPLKTLSFQNFLYKSQQNKLYLDSYDETVERSQSKTNQNIWQILFTERLQDSLKNNLLVNLKKCFMELLSFLKHISQLEGSNKEMVSTLTNSLCNLVPMTIDRLDLINYECLIIGAKEKLSQSFDANNSSLSFVDTAPLGVDDNHLIQVYIWIDRRRNVVNKINVLIDWATALVPYNASEDNVLGGGLRHDMLKTTMQDLFTNYTNCGLFILYRSEVERQQCARASFNLPDSCFVKY